MRRRSRNEHCLGASGTRTAVGRTCFGPHGSQGRRRRRADLARPVGGRMGRLWRTRRRRDHRMDLDLPCLCRSCCRGLCPHRGCRWIHLRVAVAAAPALGQVEKPSASCIGRSGSCRDLSRDSCRSPHSSRFLRSLHRSDCCSKCWHHGGLELATIGATRSTASSVTDPLSGTLAPGVGRDDTRDYPG